MIYTWKGDIYIRVAELDADFQTYRHVDVDVGVDVGDRPP